MAAVENLIKYIIENTGFKIALIPHVIKERDNDITLLSQLYEKYKSTDRFVLIDKKLNAHQLKGCIAKCRFFVGARTHSTIAAYSSCVPTLALSYSIKSVGIARDIFGDEKGLVVSLINIKDENEITDCFKELVKNETYYKNTLQQAMPEYIQSAYKSAEVFKLFER